MLIWPSASPPPWGTCTLCKPSGLARHEASRSCALVQPSLPLAQPARIAQSLDDVLLGMCVCARHRAAGPPQRTPAPASMPLTPG